MRAKKAVPQQDTMADLQRKLEEERQKLVVQKVRLPNGATFTRLKPVAAN